MKTALIIPVHNRKAVTLKCLSQFDSLEPSQWSIIVIDDGSTDGTSEAILKDFPHVTLLKGDGNLYWTGAIEMGMRHAISSSAQCCVWVNDDMTLNIDSLCVLVDFSVSRKALASAQGLIKREDVGLWFFPALFKGRSGLVTREVDSSSSEPFLSDTTRGNLVAIPAEIVREIGYPDGKNIPHIGGDTDYGLRVSAAGFPCYTLPAVTFHEEENIREDNRSWLLGTRPLGKILKQSLGKRGSRYLPMVWTYNTRHWGITRGAATTFRSFAQLFLLCAARLLVPRSLLLKVYAHRSHAYQAYATLEDQ